MEWDLRKFFLFVCLFDGFLTLFFFFFLAMAMDLRLGCAVLCFVFWALDSGSSILLLCWNELLLVCSL
jgi:hypothetical protein